MATGANGEESQQHDATLQPLNDSESTINALMSPQDGTFGQRYVPEEMHLQNPNHPDAQVANKEREAREQQQEHQEAHTRNAQISQWASSSRGTWRGQPFQGDPMPSEDHNSFRPAPRIAPSVADDQASVMTHPPPAYSDIAQSISGRSRPPTLHYSTMGNENERFFPTGAPQNLGGHGRQSENEPLLGAGEGGQSHSWRKRSEWLARYFAPCVRLFAIVLALLVGLGFIMAVINRSGSDNQQVPISIDPKSNVLPPSTCPLATVVARSHITLKDPSSFNFIERSIVYSKNYESDYSNLRVKGDLAVRLDEKLSAGTIRVDLQFQASDSAIVEALQLYQGNEDDSVQLFIPGWTGSPQKGHKPCLVITGTVTIPSDTDLDTFLLSTEHLNIEWTKGTTLAARETILKGVLGGISFHGGDTAQTVRGRELVVETRTGSVKGEYPLMDLLSISTTTGEVDITVAPKKADSRRVRPAELHIETWTGDINLDMPHGADSLPDRDYRSDIKSHTGSIWARRLPHGSRTELTSSTSRIRAVLQPHGGLGDKSDVVVQSNTGDVAIAVTPHVREPGGKMQRLSAEYSTTTGTVWVTHPLQWEGSVAADTVTGGAIAVKWPGLEGSIGAGFGSIFHSFHGRKGDGKAAVNVHTRTGSITLAGKDVSELP